MIKYLDWRVAHYIWKKSIVCEDFNQPHQHVLTVNFTYDC